MFDGTLRNHTIARIERSQQQEAQQRHNGWLWRLFIGTLALLGLFSAVAGGLSLLADFPTPDIARWLLALYYALLLVLHFGLMVRTLHLAAVAVARDKSSDERWEVLAMTCVSGREIVISKWWVTVRTMWRLYLLLALLRAAAALTERLVPGLLLNFVSSYGRPPLQFDVLGTLVGTGGVMLLTLVSLPFTAACGVLATMDMTRGSGAARGFMLRTVVMGVSAFLPLLVWWVIAAVPWSGEFVTSSFTSVQNFLGHYATLLLDNGISFATGWIAPSYWTNTQSLSASVGFVLALANYGVLTWLLLRLAQWRAETSAALKPDEAKGKP